MERTKNLLGIFVIGSLYLVTVYHLTNLYFAQQVGFVRFILLEGGIYPIIFWLGYVVLGNLVPLGLIYWPARKTDCVAASVLVIVGAFALLYVFIIGGQAYPLDIFPGFTASSSFGDGQIASYRPFDLRIPAWPRWACDCFPPHHRGRSHLQLHAAGLTLHR